MSLAKVRGNGCQYGIGLVENRGVWEPDDADSDGCEVIRSRLIVCAPVFVVVHRTIQLHGESLLGAVEVQHVRSHAVLASELPARQLPSLQ